MAQKVGKWCWSTGSLCGRWLHNYLHCSCPKRSMSVRALRWRSWASITCLSTEPHSTHVNMGFSPSANCSRACLTLWRWVGRVQLLWAVGAVPLPLPSDVIVNVYTVWSYYFHSCTMKNTMKASHLATLLAVAVWTGWGWPSFTSLHEMYVLCSTPTITTRSSWLSSRELTTNSQAAASNHVSTDTVAVMSCSAPFHRSVDFSRYRETAVSSRMWITVGLKCEIC